MDKSKAAFGTFRGGIPYNRFGHGPRDLVIFQGLAFENKPLTGPWAGALNGGYRFLEADYTMYAVLRKPGLPAGATLKDMADDYAAMICEEFNPPVDVIGVSTGGSIVQHFAADHPGLVRRLVIHSSAHALGERGQEVQLRIRDLALRRRWREAYAAIFRFMMVDKGAMKALAPPAAWLGSLLAGSFGAPKDPSDLAITIEAEDKHAFKDRLGEIRAPALVAAGDLDPFYTPELFRETAEGIPNARLALYEGVGHPAGGKRFEEDVLGFLRDDSG